LVQNCYHCLKKWTAKKVIGLAMGHIFKEQKEEQPCLAGGEERLEALLVLQGRLESGWWWKWWLRRGGGASQIGDREGEK
jgi:hypothetical protein